MTVVYLDPYVLGDPLFITGLARDLAARGSGLVLVHGSGERGERALESLGRFPQATDGVWAVADADGADAVERATRELNREIVHELNEQGVASIRVAGADRGLLKLDDGTLSAGRTRWLATLVGQGVVAVVAALVDTPDGRREVDAAIASARLAQSLGADVLALTTKAVGEAVTRDALAGVVPDARAVGRMLDAGATVRLGARTSLRERDGVSSAIATG